MAELTSLTEGMPVLFGGNRVTSVPAELARAFRPGDHLLVVQSDGALLHVPAAEQALVDGAVSRATRAFRDLALVPDEAITAFFAAFAARLADDRLVAPVLAANEADAADARARRRSTTRLVLSPAMRAGMIEGLREWRDAPAGRDQLLEAVEHDGWRVEQRRAPLGVVGFVFEGRPNVFADATGLLRTGNTVVFRIGSDALGTARAIVEHLLVPALAEAGLPDGSVGLLDTPSRSAGWALFSHPGLALAVARGSGQAVAQLGAVARQTGTPVSLHGTGGAWLVAGRKADATAFEQAVLHSLDRKVCNTLNVGCVLDEHAGTLVPAFLRALREAALLRGTEAKLHVAAGSERWVDPAWFARSVPVSRAEGQVDEPQADVLPVDELGREWEWEASPEVSLVVVGDLGEAVHLVNTRSPRLAASLVSDDPGEHDAFWAATDLPFVGNGFTRWVDGQFALGRPELGLSSWQHGRLFARSAVLSGDGVFSVRTRAWQEDPLLHR